MDRNFLIACFLNFLEQTRVFEHNTLRNRFIIIICSCYFTEKSVLKCVFTGVLGPDSFDCRLLKLPKTDTSQYRPNRFVLCIVGFRKLHCIMYMNSRGVLRNCSNAKCSEWYVQNLIDMDTYHTSL